MIAHLPKVFNKALIVANGQSVDTVGDEFWEKVFASEITVVGTNRCLCFEVFKKHKPHVMVIRDTYRNLWSDQKYGELYHDMFWKLFEGWKVGPAERRYTFCDEYVQQAEGWQLQKNTNEYDEAFVMKNTTVALMAANWAWINGAREIYLLGVDYFGAHGEMVSPFASADVGWQGQYEKPVPRQVEREFSQAVNAVESAGGTMRNLSAGSKLCAVGKADLERFFE